MRYLAVAMAALTLGGCFSSDKDLLSGADLVAPIADGAIYEFSPSVEDEQTNLIVRFVQDERRYELHSVPGESDTHIRVTFTEITGTAEQDYVAQVEMRGEGQVRYLYWFVWPRGDGRYLLMTQAVASDDIGQPISDPCAATLGGCRFNTLDDLLRHYLNVAHPMFSRGRWPSSYVDMIPVQTAD